MGFAMGFVSDLLLAAGAFGAAVFCLVLSRRLKALTALDSGMGAAIAVLSAQVDDLTRALKAAQEAAQGTSGRLAAQTERAEAAARRLELLVASLHDLPEAAPRPAPARSSGAWGERPAPAPERGSERAPDPFAAEGAEAGHDLAPRARILRRRSPERAA
jgi:hypothetical protein